MIKNISYIKDRLEDIISVKAEYTYVFKTNDEVINYAALSKSIKDITTSDLSKKNRITLSALNQALIGWGKLPEKHPFYVRHGILCTVALKTPTGSENATVIAGVQTTVDETWAKPPYSLLRSIRNYAVHSRRDIVENGKITAEQDALLTCLELIEIDVSLTNLKKRVPNGLASKDLLLSAYSSDIDNLRVEMFEEQADRLNKMFEGVE